MRRPAPHTRPPSIAARLVSLFGSADQAESILGDLEEEFSDIASKSAAASARRWHWRQSLKTIAQLAGAAVRNAPWFSRSEEHTSELQSRLHPVCRLLLSTNI